MPSDDWLETPLGRQVAQLSEQERRDLAATLIPRLNRYVRQQPTPWQQAFLMMNQLEVFAGGAAGPGKSSGLIQGALQYVDVPGYAALLLRRVSADLDFPGGILHRAKQWLAGTPAKPVGNYQRTWKFPSGAMVVFGYARTHADVERQFSGSEWHYIGIDELTQWEQRSYEFLFARLRKPDWICSTCQGPLMRSTMGWLHKDPDVFPDQIPILSSCERPVPLPQPLAPDGLAAADIPLRMRSTSNPMGVGHAWVKARFVDPETREPGAVFLPGRLSDNPYLNRAAYIASLSHMGPVMIERLLNGDWDIIDEGGMFERHWFPIVDEVPADIDWIRMWDLASTEVKKGKDNRDPDWTVGTKLGLRDGIWYVADIVRIRANPFDVEKLVQQTAATDGEDVDIWMEREPGSAGVNTIDHYRREVLVGYAFHEYRPQDKKTERAKPMSAAARAGNFRLLKARWNVPFLDEAELFGLPACRHDDQIDTCSAGMTVLTRGRVRIIV